MEKSSPPALSILKEGFQKLSLGSETLLMTSEGLGEMFQGDFADKKLKRGTSSAQTEMF